MRLVLLIIFALTYSLQTLGSGKTPDGKDSMVAHVIKFAKPVFNFDARYSFINDQPVQISGFKIGVEWIEKFRTGLGFYALSTVLTKELQEVKEPTQRLDGRFRFNYLALYGEYVLLHRRKWELSAPLQLGMGLMYYEFRDRRGNSNGIDKKPIALIEPSLSGHYKIFSWIGIGSGIGYRYMLSSENKIEHNFDSPIYYIKAKLFIGELFKELKNIKKS